MESNSVPTLIKAGFSLTAVQTQAEEGLNSYKCVENFQLIFDIPHNWAAIPALYVV